MLPTRPSGTYSSREQQNPEWRAYVFHLARWNLLQLREIAALLGIAKKTLDSHDDILAVIRSGWAEAYGSVNFELLSTASADPQEYDDPAERAQVRNHKMDALKTLSKTYEKRTEFELLSEDRERDRSAIRSMSTEDLKKQAEALLKDLK